MSFALPAITPAPGHARNARRQDGVLPLTTIFTPPDDCVLPAYTLDPLQPDYELSGWWDWRQTSASCYPFSFSALQGRWGWYSPGVCPSGHAMAQSRVVETAAASEKLTQAWCCPESFRIWGITSEGQEYQYCTATSRDATALTVGSNGTLLTSVQSFVAYRWPLSVEWASADLAMFTPQSAPVLVAATTTIYSLPSGEGPSTSGRATATSASSSSSSTAVASRVAASGLSDGAKAGIGVGVAAAVLVLAALAWWLWKRGRRAATAAAAHDTNYAGGGWETKGKDARKEVQAGAWPPGELCAERALQEMEASSSGPTRVELEGSAGDPGMHRSSTK